MSRTTVSIFVEEDCTACEKVLSVARSLVGMYEINLAVFERKRDAAVFEQRNVAICPATFVNGRLVFYGEFSREELLEKIQTHSGSH